MTLPARRPATPALEALLVGLARWEPAGEDLDAARSRVADVACAIWLGASLTQWKAARRAYARGTGSVARVLPTGSPEAVTSASDLGAALAACCRITEIDDIELTTCTTPGSVVVPAALVAHARCGAAPDPGGDRLLAAVATGYEVVLEAASALGGAFAPGAGIWPTRAVAAVGAAATVARALGLPPAAAEDAVALAAGAGYAGSFPEPARSWSLGAAVARGIAAALAASEGLRGDASLLARWPGATYPIPAQDHATRVGVLDAGTSAVRRSRLKPYAAARQVLAGSAGLRALVESGEVDPADVVEVLVAVPSLHAGMIDRPSPTVRLDTLASAQFQLATALEAPHRLDELDHAPPSPAVAARMAAVRVVGDHGHAEGGEHADLGFPARWGARLELAHRGGRRTCHVVDGVPGEEAFTWEDVERKAHRLATANGADPADLDELFAMARTDDWSGLVASLAAAVLSEGGGR